MKVESLRSSSMGTYKHCPFNFFLSYIVGIPSEGNRKADRGTATHWVLETIANAARRGNASSWRYQPELLLRIFFKRNPQFNFGDEDFAECMGHLRVVEQSEYWPAKLNIIETERQFEFDVLRSGFETFAGKPAKLRGTIDLLTRYICPETGQKVLRIVDWKTGRRSDWVTDQVKTLDDLYKDVQLRLYHLISTKIYPEYDRHEVAIFFITDGGPFLITFDKDDADKTIEQIRRIFVAIKTDRHFQRLKDDPNRRDKRWKCQYVCQFGKVQRTYISDDGDVMTDVFKFDKTGDYPTVLTDGVKEYFYLQESDTTPCDEYWSILRKNGETKATEIIRNITINGKEIALSARNDYGAADIYRGVIE